MTTFSRRRFLASGSCVALCATLGYTKYVEPYWIEVTRVNIPSVDSVYANSSPLKIAHLSDLHAFDEIPLSQIDTAISLALAEKPDLVAVTGDFISGYISDAGSYQKILRRLSDAAPTFATTGNHDGGAWSVGSHTGYESSEKIRNLLEDSGIAVLHNRSVIFQREETNIQLVGLGDIWAGEFDPDMAFRDLDSHAQTIVLSHNPDTKDLLGAYPWNLMLSGHTHGGQLRIPFMGATPFAPVKDHRYVAGLNAWGDRLIHTSRGVGNILGLRFNCRPEITIMTLNV